MSARSVFADLLAAYRKEAGWTQAEAARQFNMSKSLYQKIEGCDRKPQRDMADRCDELFKTRGVFARIYRDIVTEPHPAWFTAGRHPGSAVQRLGRPRRQRACGAVRVRKPTTCRLPRRVGRGAGH